MKSNPKSTYEAMVCSNEQCDVWYRIGSHFFLTCPSCKVPMVKTVKEIQQQLKIV